jgi:hypothetical protein
VPAPCRRCCACAWCRVLPSALPSDHPLPSSLSSPLSTLCSPPCSQEAFGLASEAYAAFEAQTNALLAGDSKRYKGKDLVRRRADRFPRMNLLVLRTRFARAWVGWRLCGQEGCGLGQEPLLPTPWVDALGVSPLWPAGLSRTVSFGLAQCRYSSRASRFVMLFAILPQPASHLRPPPPAAGAPCLSAVAVRAAVPPLLPRRPRRAASVHERHGAAVRALQTGGFRVVSSGT